MNTPLPMKLCLLVSLFLLTAVPVFAQQPAEAQQAQQAQGGAPPPIEAALVREGTFAVQLAAALGIGATNDEVEAETKLGDAGITPRNGWIADYPVTPDVLGELRQSVAAAADAGKLSMNRDEALKKLDGVKNGFDLSVKPAETGTGYTTSPPTVENYPDPAAVTNYYYTEGPPVYTYYTPPPDYYYLYSWVPYPFWSFGIWFPGYFILNDFHRSFHYHDRVVFVSNHFNDIRNHHVFRVDPLARFNGRTYAGIGVRRTRGGFISTGVPSGERRIFNSSRERPSPESRGMGRGAPAYRGRPAPSRGAPPSGRSVRPSAPARGGGGGGRGFSGGGGGGSQRRR